MIRPNRQGVLILAAFCGFSCASATPAANRPASAKTAHLDAAVVSSFVAPELGRDVLLSPITLVADGGASLPLVSMTAEVALADPLAHTELHLTFENTTAASVATRLSVSLPEHAAVTRFAIRRPMPAAMTAPSHPSDGWTEANLVDRGHMRATYDDVLAARTEPDLIPNAEGAPFIANAGTVDPQAKIEIVVAYDETLTETGYRLGLVGLPKLASFNAHAVTAGSSTPLEQVTLHDEAPSGDLAIAEARYRTAVHTATGVSGNGVVAMRVPVDGPASNDALLSPIILCDTSASRMLEIGQEASVVSAIVGHLAADAEVHVAAFDQDVVPIFEGAAGDLSDEHAMDKLRARRGLGASDLSRALEWAGRTSLSNAGLHHRLVVVTDGALTAGERNPTDLTRIAKELGPQGIDRIDVISLGGSGDAKTLTALTRDPALPWRGVVVDINRGADEIARRLTHTVLPPVDIVVDGAQFVSPRRIEGAEAGDEVTILAELAHPETAMVRLGANTSRPIIRAESEPIVERRVASSKIQSIYDDPTIASADKRVKIVSLSQKHTVSSVFATFALHSDLAAKDDPSRLALLDAATRANDVEVIDAPPPSIDATDRFDPLDDSLKRPPQIEIVHKGAKPNRNKAGTTTTAPAPAAPPPPSPPPTAGTTEQSVSTDADEASNEDLLGGRIPAETIQRTVRLNHGRFRSCYQKAIAQRPKLAGRIVVKFVIDATGSVSHAEDGGSDIPSQALRDCVQKAFLALSFPAPPSGQIVVKYPLVFSMGDEPPAPRHADTVKQAAPPLPPQEPEPHYDDPYSGPYQALMTKIAHHDPKGALADAQKWQADAPRDVLAYIALGEAAEASGDQDLAARAYGSIVELWSYRADLLRTAGERLGRVGTDSALRVARDAFALARDERPDQPTGHRLLAFAEYRLGHSEQAFRVLETALNDNYDNEKFLGARMALGEDLGLLGAAWARSAPERRAEIERRTRTAGGRPETEPSMRASLLWETNTRDVDLHVGDSTGDHVSHKKHALSGGGEIRTDVIGAYGPALFSVTGPALKRNYPFSIAIAYPASGTLGFATGTVEVIEHDGKGHLKFDDRPFLVMNGHTGIELRDIVSPPIP